MASGGDVSVETKFLVVQVMAQESRRPFVRTATEHRPNNTLYGASNFTS